MRPTDRPIARMSLDEYLAWENENPVRHEYVAGSYLIIEQRRRHALAYTRDEQGEWAREEITVTGEIRLDFLDTSLSLDEIYDDVPLPPLEVGEGDDDEWYELDDDAE